MDEEIARAVMLKTLTPEQVEELFPPYPADHPDHREGTRGTYGAAECPGRRARIRFPENAFGGSLSEMPRG